MMPEEPRLGRRLRLAGTLIALGLLVEAITLMGIHPLAFLTFMFVGGGFLLAGMALFLLSIVRTAGPEVRDNRL